MRLSIASLAPPSPVDSSSSLDALLEYVDVAEQGFGGIFDALSGEE